MSESKAEQWLEGLVDTLGQDPWTDEIEEMAKEGMSIDISDALSRLGVALPEQETPHANRVRLQLALRGWHWANLEDGRYVMVPPVSGERPERTGAPMMLTECAIRAAGWWADRLDAQHAKSRDRFANAVRERIIEVLVVSGNMTLKVDHDPDAILRDALDAAGIDCAGVLFSARGILPSKTRMCIEGRTIRVRDGYGAPWEVLS